MANVKILNVRKHMRVREKRAMAFCSKPRIYVFVKNFNVLHDLFVERNDKPHAELRPLLKEALAQVGISADKLSFSWSKTAGCACGCSPGFVISGHIPSNADDYYDIFIDYEYVGEDAVRNPKPTEKPAEV